MRTFGMDPYKTEQVTSTGTSDVQTVTTGNSCSAVLITVETNAARVTFDGTTPSSSNGVVIPKDAVPLLIGFRHNRTIKAVSTVAGNSIVNVASFS